LVGPLTDAEILRDRPTQRYSTGILYPIGLTISPEEDQDGGQAVNEQEDSTSNSTEATAPLHSALKPSVAGLSFAVKPDAAGQVPMIHVDARCARYEVFHIDEDGKEVLGEGLRRADDHWRRVAYSVSIEVPLEEGEYRHPLDAHGVDGLEFYALTIRRLDLITVTAALCNRRSRGDSLLFDEEQHFFQVELQVSGVTGGAFAPRPSRKAETDEDSRIAALIYRDATEHVVGHTCSAQADLDTSGAPLRLRTEWIPSTVVHRVSDQGDPVFENLKLSEQGRPLDAIWLAKADVQDLSAGLKDLVACYREWIAGEQTRTAQLPEELRAQAKEQVKRCMRGADRMADGIQAIQSDANVRCAFQMAQEAMNLQFSWSRGGDNLTWRPFQIAFQLMVLASIADGQHPDRETMDLLWFPTGGGKTEAYLGLAAFTILLRRLRAPSDAEGRGVAVLMRYTLRLLTVQQFQRAAATICACEVLRQRAASAKKGPQLGGRPIGIGLWVGSAATPLTLAEALDRTDGDASTPVQLLDCPACQERLQWKLGRNESTVTCLAKASSCDIAAIGGRIPVWTIDEEIYRETPSLVIGTVDKFAQIVRKKETGALFGRNTKHPPPELIVQDELHLISGPLGSIAGLYEVAIDELCRVEGRRPKVIGSTATIRRAGDQIAALFDRETYQFPSPGLDAANSGFAVTDTEAPGRVYVGLTTAGRSAYYMLQALTASLLQAAASPGATPQERDYYWTLVIYFNSLRELGRSLVLMQDDVPVSVAQLASRRAEEPRALKAPAEMTSRVKGSDEIRDMLDRLKIDASDPEAVDQLLASNMISVGMDIPRLGLMVVNAQPKTLSEYIQATSRVGRGEVPGLIVTMYNSLRPRDRSRFETFETWHRALYRDVEATSVTPFASRAQDKALHAVLVGLARHLVPGMDTHPALDHARRAGVEEVAALIEERVARVDPDERTKVAQKLKRLIDEWASRPDLQTYWDDYGKKISLLLSAEQFAATADADPDLVDGSRRALWSTPNSMREVEPGAPFVLRGGLKAEGS